jgi:hypothetical protein
MFVILHIEVQMIMEGLSMQFGPFTRCLPAFMNFNILLGSMLVQPL